MVADKLSIIMMIISLVIVNSLKFSSIRRVSSFNPSFQTTVYSSLTRRIIDAKTIGSPHRLYMTGDFPPGYRRPEDIEIPADKVQVQYARSSGPGGQNVNKLNTKAEARFHIDSADWLPVEVRERLKIYQDNKISKEGELIVSSQEHRTQGQNKKDCMDKLREMIAEAYIEPKVREMWVGLSEKGKVKRKDEKRKRSVVKEGRRLKNSRDFD